MMKYLIGLGALVVVVVGYFLLVPAGSPPAPSPEPAPSVTPPAAPAPVAPQDAAPVSPDEEALLEDMAADARENLPMTVTDTLTMTDAVFQPRMRIMEYIYVTTAADARASAGDIRAMIDARAETICLEGRQMFGMGVTLRKSLEDREGNLIQRVYILPEDCQRFY